MKIGRYTISAHAFPWQDGYDWKGSKGPHAPLNKRGARFGGGWKWRLGISIGASGSIMIDCLFGYVYFARK